MWITVVSWVCAHLKTVYWSPISFFFLLDSFWLTWPPPGLTTSLVNKVALHTAVIFFHFYDFLFTVHCGSWWSCTIKENYLAQKGASLFWGADAFRLVSGLTTPLVNKVALRAAIVAVLFFHFQDFFFLLFSTHLAKLCHKNKGGNSYHQQQQIKNTSIGYKPVVIFICFGSLSLRYIFFCEKAEGKWRFRD